MNAKKTIIIIIGIIIALIIIINVYSALTSPTATIDNLQVEKEGKTYTINFTITGKNIDDYMLVHLTAYEKGKAVSSTIGDDPTGYEGENSLTIEFDKDVKIDNIHMWIYDKNHNTISPLYNFTDFKIIEIEPKDTSSDVDDSSSDDSSDYEDDGYELAKSNRGKYDYDGDGFLNDYEFQKFCEGEGQEYLLDY